MRGNHALGGFCMRMGKSLYVYSKLCVMCGLMHTLLHKYVYDGPYHRMLKKKPLYGTGRTYLLKGVYMHYDSESGVYCEDVYAHTDSSRYYFSPFGFLMTIVNWAILAILAIALAAIWLFNAVVSVLLTS